MKKVHIKTRRSNPCGCSSKIFKSFKPPFAVEAHVCRTCGGQKAGFDAQIGKITVEQLKSRCAVAQNLCYPAVFHQLVHLVCLKTNQRAVRRALYLALAHDIPQRNVLFEQKSRFFRRRSVSVQTESLLQQSPELILFVALIKGHTAALYAGKAA